MIRLPRLRGRIGAALLLALTAGCAQPPPAAPPAAVGPPTRLVVTAHPLATAAGLAMLRRGGAPIDAAVAAQAVLGLVEPQASGPGGGSVILTWQAQAGRLAVFDGTPRAGQAAPAGLNADADGRPVDPRNAMYGGAAVGVPGTLPALWAAHRAQGRLAWAELFAPAIRLAEEGFAMPRALHDLLTGPSAAGYAAVAAAYLGPDGAAPPVGATLRNPAYAATLRRVAQRGPEGLFAEAAMGEALAALRQGARPSHLSAVDLRTPPAIAPAAASCLKWLGWNLCTAPMPVYGGTVALQTLAMAGPGDLDQPAEAHRFLEAARLAQADRRRYAADPALTPVPAAGLLNPDYLAARAGLIRPDSTLPRPAAGDPPDPEQARRAPDPGAPTTATSQIVVVDAAGDALSMTSSLTHAFGARVGFGGLALNNALVNFAPMPPSGVRYANEMAPDKRPATPMAPVMAFDGAGRLVLLGGSGGGPGVPDYVAAALIDLLPRHRPPAEALARPHLSAADLDHVAVEAGTVAERLLPALRALGHQAEADRLPSGSAFIVRDGSGWAGAADPRRDGVAQGE